MEWIPFQVNDAELRTAFLTRSLPEAMQRLDHDTAPRWGAMSAQHMVEHLLWAFGLSTGKETITCGIPEEQYKKMKAWLYDDRPSPREFKNPRLSAAPEPLNFPTLDAARLALLGEIQVFVHQRSAGSEVARTHPVFGALFPEEWERVHFKHSYHHLEQFALIGTPGSPCP